jgi:hypothetical protein
VLAETGTIGFALFASWLGAVLWDLWKTIQSSEVARRKSLAAVWLAVAVSTCIVGLTHNTHYAKHLWIVSGIALAIYDVPQNQSGSFPAKNSEMITSNQHRYPQRESEN